MIREITDDDIPTLVQYGKFFWTKTPYVSTGMEYNPGHVAALLEDLKEQHYLRVFSTKEGEIIGFIGFFVVPFTFNPDYTQAQEIFFFVHPAYRGEIGHDLLTQAELDLKDIADIMVCGDMMSSKDMTEYYEEHGFRLTERSYTKVL